MDAPNFSGTFPNAGERIGPLWRDMWKALADGKVRRGKDFAKYWAGRHGVTTQCAAGLLRQGAKSGHLVQEYRTRGKGGPGLTDSYYRRPR